MDYDPSKDYYQILGVAPSATAEQVKRAFRRRARELHPDVNPDPKAREQFQDLEAAYTTLSKHRAAYDWARRNYRNAPPPPPPVMDAPLIRLSGKRVNFGAVTFGATALPRRIRVYNDGGEAEEVIVSAMSGSFWHSKPTNPLDDEALVYQIFYLDTGVPAGDYAEEIEISLANSGGISRAAVTIQTQIQPPLPPPPSGYPYSSAKPTAAAPPPRMPGAAAPSPPMSTVPSSSHRFLVGGSLALTLLIVGFVGFSFLVVLHAVLKPGQTHLQNAYGNDASALTAATGSQVIQPLTPAQQNWQQAAAALPSRLAALQFECLDPHLCRIYPWETINPLPIFIDGMDEELDSYLLKLKYSASWSDNFGQKFDGLEMLSGVYTLQDQHGLDMDSGLPPYNSAFGLGMALPDIFNWKPTVYTWIIQWTLRDSTGQVARQLTYRLPLAACPSDKWGQVTCPHAGDDWSAQLHSFQPMPLFVYDKTLSQD